MTEDFVELLQILSGILSIEVTLSQLESETIGSVEPFDLDKMAHQSILRQKIHTYENLINHTIPYMIDKIHQTHLSQEHEGQ